VIRLYKGFSRLYASGPLRSDCLMVPFELVEEAFEATMVDARDLEVLLLVKSALSYAVTA
jgi:hypothetical protein